MINPKNYRLGNLLKEVDSGQIVEVIGVKKEIKKRISKYFENEIIEEFFTIEVSGKYEGEWKLEEIPLTEEILLLLGFKKFNKNKYFHPETTCFEIQNTSGLDGGFRAQAVRWVRGDGFSLSTPILTVDRVQNYFFSATEKELNVSKLNVQPIPLHP